jgi:uncharacterized protein (DUF488 family)
VADVRRYPGSRRNPQFNADALAESLAAERIALVPMGAQLGGRRKPRSGSPNGGWRVEGFQGYADHMESEDFRSGLAELERLAESSPTSVMCAEGDWHRCHRRLIADALLARGWRVLHMLPEGGTEEHRLTEFAVLGEGRLTYPPPQQSLA